MDGEKRQMLRFPVRYYQMWPAISPGGEVQKLIELPVAQTCFIEMRCWNVGYPDGPALPVDLWHIQGGVPQGGEGGADAIVREITESCIAPAMAAARAAGMPIFHVQPRLVGDKHPESRFMLEPEDVEPPDYSEAVPGWRKQRADKVHGFGHREWEGWDSLDIAPPVALQEGDYGIITGAQFDRVLRHLGVVNLIYTGFDAYSSLLHAPGGIREMKFGYGYRPILLRECTLRQECPDTADELLLTRTAYRFVEQQCGYTARLEDFLTACRTVGVKVAQGANQDG